MALTTASKRNAAADDLAIRLRSASPELARSFEHSENRDWDGGLINFAVKTRELMLISRRGSSDEVEAARQAFRATPIYRWLTKELRDVQLEDCDPTDECVKAFCYLIGLSASSTERPKAARKTRPDKLRRTAANDIKRIKQHLDEGTIDLPLSKVSQLRALLIDAEEALALPHPKTVDHPSLLAAAQLLLLCGLADPAILLRVAAESSIDCDESTARRYIAAANL